MVLRASQLLQPNEDFSLSPVTRSILSVIDVVLDRNGAAEWNLHVVAVISFLVLASVRLVLGKKRGIIWYALLHALVSATGSLMCSYLDVFESEQLTGIQEPLRSCQCQGPFTSLHRLLPAVTLGYAIFDVLDGLSISIDFVLHGLATFLVMAYFCEIQQPHFVTPMLLMEVSTPYLNIVRADFFPTTLSIINQGLFALCFFLFRILIVPYLWVRLMHAFLLEYQTERYQNCFPKSLFPVSFAVGVLFHILNVYWFVKIVKKIRRKMKKQEGIHANNDLGEKEQQNGLHHLIEKKD